MYRKSKKRLKKLEKVNGKTKVNRYFHLPSKKPPELIREVKDTDPKVRIDIGYQKSNPILEKTLELLHRDRQTKSSALARGSI